VIAPDQEVIVEWINTEHYRTLIQEVLAEYGSYHIPFGVESEMETIFDTVRDHYQLVGTGWRGSERNYGTLIHLDLKGEKIWIQYDGTEVGIANELVERGVPKEDIVLAFHAPYKRPLTGFAVG
jgi:hypothetical protein